MQKAITSRVRLRIEAIFLASSHRQTVLLQNIENDEVISSEESRQGNNEFIKAYHASASGAANLSIANSKPQKISGAIFTPNVPG